jgi:choline dehydrogenase-like flavoprotein
VTEVRQERRDTGAVDEDNPWPGLAAFRERDHPFFHGRGPAIEALSARLVVLYSASGLGKTSLIQAGLARRLRGLDFLRWCCDSRCPKRPARSWIRSRRR